jgi:hypothetical protein
LHNIREQAEDSKWEARHASDRKAERRADEIMMMVGRRLRELSLPPPLPMGSPAVRSPAGTT